MADGRDPPVLHVGEELRRIIAERRRMRRRLGTAILIGGTVAPLLASLMWKPPTLLVWNASASAPIGLYRISAGAPVRRGDMVVAWTPGPARSLAARRHYLPDNVPLVKRVAALVGDRVCAASSSISIDGRRVAMRQRLDAAGRAMPWWSGCRDLGPGEYFLLMDSPASFDGRYFGVTQRQDLVGRAVLIWTKPTRGSSDG
jgi:conjugative transfer signal peptidase TraF